MKNILLRIFFSFWKTKKIQIHEEFVGYIWVTECCKRGPITDEKFCPYCGRKIIK